MSDLLAIGSSGLAAYRNALNAIGENVANAESPGFSRRRIELKQSLVNAGSDIVYREQILFNGVETGGVQRAWDQFKSTEARFATSAAGRAGVREQWLSNVETALNDGPTGVGSSLTTFFNSATALAADPGDALGRGAMLTSLSDVATAFRSSAEALGRVSDGVRDSATLDVTAVNNALSALRDLNGTIRSASPGGSARASLEDQRDQLIDFVSERIDIAVTINGDGTAAIAAGSDSGVSLLGGQGAGLLSLVQATDGRLSLQIYTNGTTMPLPAAGGKLAGFVEVASAAADRRAGLDALAADFVATVNGWSAGGIDADGNVGADLIEAPTGAGSMRTLTADPDKIAAASTGGGGTPNGNLLALDALRETSGIEGRWGNLVSENAQSLASARSEASAAASWRDLSKAALDEVTGIDLDYEAAELLRYQQAYNASARIIQVARETIDALFAAM
jgi:flagellar hook-associated protein 1 FlgK